MRLVLLNAVYERAGFDEAPLSDGQRRFRTDNMDAYWAQMDELASVLRESKRGDALGVVVHSMRAVGVQSLRHVAKEAHAREMVVHVHLEEQPKEIEDCRNTHGMTPMALLLSSVESPDHLSRFCGVHCTHSDPRELREFLDAGGSVCICPLTEAALGDGVFRSLDETNGFVR